LVGTPSRLAQSISHFTHMVFYLLQNARHRAVERGVLLLLPAGFGELNEQIVTGGNSNEVDGRASFCRAKDAKT
jgi:hypothetical protein